MATYDEDDVRFEYPDNWALTVEGDASERTISLDSPDSAFWVMTIYGEPMSPIALINQATEAFASEYDDAEVSVVEAEIHGFEVDGRIIDFSCLDLIGQATLAAFASHRRTFFLLGQRSDLDADTADDVFRAIVTSLQLPTE